MAFICEIWGSTEIIKQEGTPSEILLSNATRIIFKSSNKKGVPFCTTLLAFHLFYL